MMEDWYVACRGWLVLIVIHIAWMIALTAHVHRDVWRTLYSVTTPLESLKLCVLLGIFTPTSQRYNVRNPSSAHSSSSSVRVSSLGHATCVPHQRSTQSTSSTVNMEKPRTRTGNQSFQVSAGNGIHVVRRTPPNRTPKVSTTSKTRPRSTGTSVATIILEDEDDEDVTSDDSSKPSVSVDDPDMILTPPPAFRSSDVVNGKNSKSLFVNAEVNRRPKPATQEPSGHKNNSQPVPIQVRTSKTRDHQRRQQQGSSSTTQDAPVPAPRHPKANQRPPHRAEKDNRYQDVGQADGHRQNEVKGQGHSGSSRDKSGSYSSKDDSKDAEELTVKYADSDVDDGVFGSSSSSSPRSDENSSSTRSASYSVRWIGSAPISAQLRGKQRSDMVIALTNKLSSAVENLGRGAGQLLRVSSSRVETLDTHNGAVVHSYPFSDIAEYHAMTIPAASQSSYFILVTHDRHFGDICHVFECAHQLARSLAADLHDVFITSEVPNEIKVSSGQERKPRVIANGGKAIETVVDNQNNNVAIESPVTYTENGVRCKYIGVAEVSKPSGIGMLQRAILMLVKEVSRDHWRDVTVRVTASAVEMYKGSRKQATYDIRFITFLGIDSEDKAIGAFVAQQGNSSNKQWFAHGFYCPPSAGPFIEAIKLACQARYESHRRLSERNDPSDSAAADQRSTSSAQPSEHQRRLADEHHPISPHVQQHQQRIPQRSTSSASNPPTSYPYAMPFVQHAQRPVKYLAARAPNQRRSENDTTKQDVKDEMHKNDSATHARQR